MGVAVDALMALVSDIATQDFLARRDAAEAREEIFRRSCDDVVSTCADFSQVPFSIDAHRNWQREVVTDVYGKLRDVSAQFLSLQLSEVHVGCSSDKMATRIREWVVRERLTLPEVAYRQLRQDNLRLGLALCISARYLLNELSE